MVQLHNLQQFSSDVTVMRMATIGIKDSLNSQAVPKILILFKNDTTWFYTGSGSSYFSNTQIKCRISCLTFYSKHSQRGRVLVTCHYNCHKHEQMYSCYIGCLQDPCCLAVELAEECEMSYFTTETMDLLKEVNFHNSQDLALFILICILYQLS